MLFTEAKSADVPRPPPPPIPQGDRPRQPIVPPAPSEHRVLGPPPLSGAPAQPSLPPPRPSGRLDKPVTPPVMTRGDRPRVPLVPPSVTVRPGAQQLGRTSRTGRGLGVLSLTPRLAMSLPKQQPLQPPGVPEGASQCFIHEVSREGVIISPMQLGIAHARSTIHR